MVPKASDSETRNVEQVDQAVAALGAADLAAAEALLLGVIPNIPADYSNSSENPDGSEAAASS